MENNNIDYYRIAAAIEYIQLNYKAQPSLEDVANAVNMSPFHFQRLFSDWAGTSPKKFLQFTSLAYAKSLLKENQATLFDTANEIGLSGTSRLHDMFINIEGMSPAEYKNGAKNMQINYSYVDSIFGYILVASTNKGICYMSFVDDEQQSLKALYDQFSKANFKQTTDEIQQNATSIFKKDWTNLKQIKLHLKGTAFQLKVWHTLLKIPPGHLTTYGNIASQIEQPNSSRAVGTAIGSNPVAFLIPCHRIIRTSGALGGYMWGNTRKSAIIAWEATKKNHEI